MTGNDGMAGGASMACNTGSEGNGSLQRTYEIKELADGVYRLEGHQGECLMYLVVGTEKACLIDTGMGVCDLRQTIRSVTDKPFFAINTHCHIDHCLGNNQFEEVYVTKESLPDLESSLKEQRGMPPRADEVEDKQVFETDYGFAEDGDTFYLGGRTLSVVFTPGHTPGDICIIDDKSRIAFVGDLVTAGSHMCHMLAYVRDMAFTTVSIETWDRSLRKMQGMQDGFDWMLSGHDEDLLGHDVLQRTIDLERSILDGTAKPYHPQLPEMYGGLVCWEVDDGEMSIIYHEETIFDRES